MTETITLSVEGMTCDHCVRAVTEALESVQGVKDAEVNLDEKRATVSGESIDRDALVDAVAEEGYEASVRAS